MIEKEIEFKNLLDKDDYDKLYEKLELKNIPSVHNANYYYDDSSNNLHLNNAAIRIRHSESKKEITLKIKGTHENIEVNVSLNNDTVLEKLEPRDLPFEIQQTLEKYNIKITTLKLFQQIKTLRKEKHSYNGLIVLDKTTFLNNIIDYELEFEVKDYNQGKKDFEKLLNDFNIEKNPAEPKIARAVKYQN